MRYTEAMLAVIDGAVARRPGWPAHVYVTATPGNAVSAEQLWSPANRALLRDAHVAEAQVDTTYNVVRIAPGANARISPGQTTLMDADRAATDWYTMQVTQDGVA